MIFKVDKAVLKKIYKKRDPEAKKYDFGLLLVIGGSEFYTGSPALAGMAGYRVGCDMVHILSPQRAANIIASFSPVLAAYQLEGKVLTQNNLPVLLERTEAAKMVTDGKTAVVIGGGLGRSSQTQETILEYLRRIDVPCVIDADAIHALAKDVSVVKNKKILITPHLYEFYVLTGTKVSNLSLKERIEVVGEKARKLGVTILLKGKTDIIAHPFSGDVALNELGSPTLTVGGTGDVLAGIAGALLARGVEPFEAGCAAALINALAGLRAAKKFGEGTIATDILEEIPQVLPKTC